MLGDVGFYELLLSVVAEHFVETIEH